MARSVWELFVALFSRGDGDDDGSTREGGEGRFVPSPLDLSVRIAHGGTDNERLRALSDVDEQARHLEERRREQ